MTGAHIRRMDIGNFEMERQLLARYSAQLERVRHEVASLLVQQRALQEAISGLQAVIAMGEATRGGSAVGLPQRLVTGSDGATYARPALPRRELSEGGVAEAAVEMLRLVDRPLAAKVIERMMASRGYKVPYHTVYKALRREADRPDGRVIRDGEHYALRKQRTETGGENQ